MLIVCSTILGTLWRNGTFFRGGGSSKKEYLDVWVYFSVEENQKSEGDDSDGDEPEPVKVDGVVRVRPQLRRLQDGEELCDVGLDAVHQDVDDEHFWKSRKKT